MDLISATVGDVGLKWSSEKILGWRTRWAAVRRWRERCCGCFEEGHCVNDHDFVDFFIAFMVMSYSLRDFVIHSGGVSKAQIDALIADCAPMRLCRDICNRGKHHTLDMKASADADWSLGREYILRSNGHHRWFLIADGIKSDPLVIVDACMKFWGDLIEQNRFAEPSDPFAKRNPL